MHIYVYNPDNGVGELAAFCRDMMGRSYHPAYSREVLGQFIEYHNAGNIARDVKAGRIWCAEEGGRLVGTVTVAEGELTRMFVAPQMRGKGLGRLLAGEALSWARETGIKKLTAWSVPFSRGFYEKCGFYMVNADVLNFNNTREPPVPYIEMALRPGGEERVEICKAAERDAEELLAAQREAFVEQCEIYGDWDIPPMHETAEGFAAFIRSGGEALKAVSRGRIIGSARGKVKDGSCEVGRLFVAPGFQGRSAARRLMAALEEKMRGRGAFSLFTGERSEKNLALYAKQGYAPTGRRAPANAKAGEGAYDLVWLEKPDPWPEIEACARRFRPE
jgi:GNAT superfamily N-acetyltransferase